jgi:hypothetical protein
VILLAAWPLVGCGSNEPDPDALAVAKCHLPLVERLDLGSERAPNESNLQVRDLGDGRREVTGGATVSANGDVGTFRCVVAPDASDRLRGLRVESLEVR